MYKLIALLVIFGISYIKADTPVYQCDNGLPLPTATQVNDCEALPCEMPQGSTVNMLATFKAGVSTEVLRPQVIAYALDLEVDYPLDEPDACNALVDMKCPIEEGETVRYLMKMPVLSIFPEIPLKMKFTMYDENDDGMVCFMIDAQITAPVDKV